MIGATNEKVFRYRDIDGNPGISPRAILRHTTDAINRQ
jgi:hypothetical protein